LPSTTRVFGDLWLNIFAASSAQNIFRLFNEICTMTSPAKIKRLVCVRCLRPQATCICHWITPIAHASEVIVLQHPLEVYNAKGSARLLHLSLPNSRLLVGESFPERELHALLHAPLPQHTTGNPLPGTMRTILLYPDTAEDKTVPAPSLLDETACCAPAQYRLVVLDGTWRKSRKMLYLNPLLQQLPRLSLRNVPASYYLIRKAHKPDQLSTFEATCHALMQLEGNDEKYCPLLAAFDGFVAQQLAYAHADRTRGETV
jgi:DTW domain-containing protein